MRLGEHQRVLAEDDHPVREPHIIGDLAAAPIGQHDGHDPRLRLLPWHRARHVHPRPTSDIDDDLVERLPGRAVGRQVWTCHNPTRRGGDEPAIGQPIDRERHPTYARHDLAVRVGVEHQHLAGEPVAHPEPAVMPPRGLAHLNPRRKHFTHTQGDAPRRRFSSVKSPPPSARRGQLARAGTRAVDHHRGRVSRP